MKQFFNLLMIVGLFFFTSGKSLLYGQDCPTSIEPIHITEDACSFTLPNVPSDAEILALVENPDNAIVIWDQPIDVEMINDLEPCAPVDFVYTYHIGCLEDPGVMLEGGSYTASVYPPIVAPDITVEVIDGICTGSYQSVCPEYEYDPPEIDVSQDFQSVAISNAAGCSLDAEVPIPDCPFDFYFEGIAYASYLAPFEAVTGTGILCYNYFNPADAAPKYMNVCAIGTDGTEVWIIKNVVLHPFPEWVSMCTYFPLNLVGLVQGIPGYELPLSINISDQAVKEPVLNDPCPGDFFAAFLNPMDIFFGSAVLDQLPFGPEGPSPVGFSNIYLPLDELDYVQRANDMPNIDLDQVAYPPDDLYAGDFAAGAPAATANSFQWLRTQSPLLDSLLGDAFGNGSTAHRNTLTKLSEEMERIPYEPLIPKDVIIGKLTTIREIDAPVYVTYQSIFQNNDISLPDAAFDEIAYNENLPENTNAPNADISLDSILNKMKDGKDVELHIYWYDEVNKEFFAGQAFTLAGIEKFGNNWRLILKDDINQSETNPDIDGLRHVSILVYEVPLSFPEPFYRGMIAVPTMDAGPFDAYVGDVIFEDETDFRYEYGDAPEGALAYPVDPAIPTPPLPVMGQFPTCELAGPAGFVRHDIPWPFIDPLFIGGGVDFEWDGNAGPPCVFPAYDMDECQVDPDSDPLLLPGSFTLVGGTIQPCPGAPVSPLVPEAGDPAFWGIDIDFTVTNGLVPPQPATLNVLIDLNQNGKWGDLIILPDGTFQSEHVLVNLPIPPGYSGPASGLGIFGQTFFTDPGIMGHAWIRITVSPGGVAPDWEGSGIFVYGESEDHLILLSLTEYGDAPENALAYEDPYPGIPSPPAVFGAFPTCRPVNRIVHTNPEPGKLFLGPTVDYELDGNAGPPCGFPPYDQDECLVPDGGLLLPDAFTMFGTKPCIPGRTWYLNYPCFLNTWGPGGNIDISATNLLPSGANAFANVLIDWNRDGVWGGSSVCADGSVAPEHVLVNQPVPWGALFAPINGPPFFSGPEPGFVWMRVSISENPAPLPWDGSGVFNWGETEDFLILVAADYGDAPEAKLAYPNEPGPGDDVYGSFPTCRFTGPSTYIVHGNLEGYFGLGKDHENNGNAELCPGYAQYDADECATDFVTNTGLIDAGLTRPDIFTLIGGVVEPCSGSAGDEYLGGAGDLVIWGDNIDILVENDLPNGLPGYVNVLVDLNQDGDWDDYVVSANGTGQDEHVLIDQYVPNGYSGLLSNVGTTPVVPFYLCDETGPVWVRFSFTEVPLGFNWEGDGEYDYGETEDYLLMIDPNSQPLALDFGDAPEGKLAYPASGVIGDFPSCLSPDINDGTYIWHVGNLVYFGDLWDGELDGNASLCPDFPLYDQDECFNDLDAGLLLPKPYTIVADTVAPCDMISGEAMKSPYQWAVWGDDIDIFVRNLLDLEMYVNVLFDWNQDGDWKDVLNTFGGQIPEHVLANFPVPGGYEGPLSSLLPDDFRIGPNSGHVWARFMISDSIVPSGWYGEGKYLYGETEDYLIEIGFCPDVIVFDQGGLPSGYYEAGIIEASVPVISGPTVLQAEQYVGLYAGFEASFIDLTIRIGDCGTVPPALLLEEDLATPTSYINLEDEEVQARDAEPDRYLKLYPNPANETLNFAFSEPFDQPGMLSIRILNSYGQNILYEERGIAQQGEINISSLPSGLYWIAMEWKGEKVASKFVKL